MAKYYKENKPKVLARANTYYTNNRKSIREKNETKYYSNIKKSRNRQNQYYNKNKVHLAAQEKKRYWNEREKRCERTANYYAKNKVRVNKRIKKYRIRKPEIQLKSQKKKLKIESSMFNKTSVEYVYALMCWKKVLVKRDDGACVYCGAKGKRAKIEGHHIIYKHTEIRLALNENNGCLLCSKCHDEVHRLNPIRYVRRQ